MLGINETLVELWLLNCLLAYSAYIVLTGGSFTLAYVAFIAIGAYTAGIGVTEHGFSLAEGLLVAPVCAGALALLIGRPLERLSGIYLSIASVGVVGLVQVLLLNLDGTTGGALGIPGINPPVSIALLVVAVVLVAIALRQVQHSNVGRAIRMTRIDPLVAGAMGVNVKRLRLWLFFGSAIIGCEAGVLRAHYFGFVTPEDYGFDMVVQLLAMVIIGGMGSWVGPLVGAAIFTLLPEWLRSFGDWRDVVTGVLLLAIIIVSREGVVGALRVQAHRQRQRLARRNRAVAAAAPEPVVVTADVREEQLR
jgi:branched-chain amino acid transport system permease protein